MLKKYLGMSRRFYPLILFFSLVYIVLSSCFCLNSGFSQEGASLSPVNLPPKEKFRIVVLAGQSNMAGRGVVEREDRIPIPRVFMLNRKGQWVPAVDPVHYDKPSAGVGPGREFARLLAETDPTIAVGLVPTACGGSSIDDWEPNAFLKQTNSHPFDDAIQRINRALEDGTLEVILWRQGESDTTPEKAQGYEAKLQRLFERFRKILNSPNVPILVGELYMPTAPPASAEELRRSQTAVVERSQPSAFVSAEGTVLNPDKIHFNRDSQLEQGRRFFSAFLEVKNRRLEKK